MTYDRFEDTPVWRAAADLAAAIFDWVEHPAFRGRGDLADQLQRAALSVSNNIAEGFERGTTNEYKFNQELLARLEAQRQMRQADESPGGETDGQEETDSQSGGNS